MTMPTHAEREFAERESGRLLDVLIRAGLILALAMLCDIFLLPFLLVAFRRKSPREIVDATVGETAIPAGAD